MATLSFAHHQCAKPVAIFLEKVVLAYCSLEICCNLFSLHSWFLFLYLCQAWTRGRQQYWRNFVNGPCRHHDGRCGHHGRRHNRLRSWATHLTMHLSWNFMVTQSKSLMTLRWPSRTTDFSLWLEILPWSGWLEDFSMEGLMIGVHFSFFNRRRYFLNLIYLENLACIVYVDRI